MACRGTSRNCRGRWSFSRVTTVARKALGDCKIIHQMMETETDANRLRALWIGGLALLRTVGHVLQKVDGKDEQIAVSLARIWPQRRKDSIFRDFIENSRNRAIKEYEFDIYDLSTVLVVTENERGSQVPSLFNDCEFMPLLDGFGAGNDARDVYDAAIRWWNDVLGEVERK